MSCTTIHEINEELLIITAGVGGYIGLGSFSVVSFKTFREIDVAVKELLPRTNVTDVLREVKILSTLSHPYLYLISLEFAPKQNHTR